jgi:hypothetical protein
MIPIVQIWGFDFLTRNKNQHQRRIEQAAHLNQKMYEKKQGRKMAGEKSKQKLYKVARRLQTTDFTVSCDRLRITTMRQKVTTNFNDR